ncbi:MAG: hypothetical protein V2A73_02790 [Pseudomonadota bacterium]
MKIVRFLVGLSLAFLCSCDDGIVRSDVPPRDVAPRDVAPIDARPLDARPLDARPIDARPVDAAPIDAMPIDAAAAGEGEIRIYELSFVGMDMSGAPAVFRNGRRWGEVTATGGGCDVYPGHAGNGQAFAGDIEITGASASPIKLSVVNDEYYKVQGDEDLPGNLFEPGNTLSVVAAGSEEIPAFAGSVVAPVPVTGATTPKVVRRSEPLELGWDPGGASTMFIWLVGVDEDDKLACKTPDTGSYVVAPEALALLSPNNTSVILWYLRINETVVTAGSWRIFLDAASVLVPGTDMLNMTIAFAP